MAKIVKGSTKRGQELIARGVEYEGITLGQVYDSWSRSKQEAYDWCYEKYLNTEEHTSFGICSHNTFQFTVSWLGIYDGENALFLETRDNSYIILMDK